MAAMEPSAISRMGTTMGASAAAPPGSLPNSATSSSYVLAVSPSHASSPAFTFLPMYFAKK